MDDDDAAAEAPRPPVIRDQDRFLPVANVSKCMKAAHPAGKVSKEARELMQECASEFISFVVSEAAERSANSKSLSCDTLLQSLDDLGFDSFVAPLTVYAQRFREAHRGSGRSRGQRGGAGRGRGGQGRGRGRGRGRSDSAPTTATGAAAAAVDDPEGDSNHYAAAAVLFNGGREKFSAAAAGDDDDGSEDQEQFDGLSTDSSND